MLGAEVDAAAPKPKTGDEVDAEAAAELAGAAPKLNPWAPLDAAAAGAEDAAAGKKYPLTKSQQSSFRSSSCRSNPTQGLVVSCL